MLVKTVEFAVLALVDLVKHIRINRHLGKYTIVVKKKTRLKIWPLKYVSVRERERQTDGDSRSDLKA